MRTRSMYILMVVLIVLIVCLLCWSWRGDKLKETNSELPQGRKKIERASYPGSVSHVKEPGNNTTLPPGTYLVPYMGMYKCSTPNCSQFLTEDDRIKYKECGNGMPRNVKCHFMDGTNRSPVALASYPGCGNTWVRGLLEQVTGICTGSIYCDDVLKDGGMNGENLRGGSVLVTKTHSMRPIKWGSILTTIDMYSIEDTPYGAAILIVRNPFDSMVSLYGWDTMRSHTQELGRKVIGDPWVKRNALWWKSMFTAWIEANTEDKPLLVIKYENLKSNVLPEVERMLQFLHVPYSREELIRILEADYGKFHRSHADNFDHFSATSRKFVHDVIQESLVLLREKNNGNTFGIEDYLL